MFGFCIERVLEVLSEANWYELGIEVLNQKPLVLVRHFSDSKVLQVDVHMDCSGRHVWVSRQTTAELINQFRSGTIPLEMLFIADIDDEDSILMIDCSKAMMKEYASIKDVPDDIKKGLEV